MKKVENITIQFLNLLQALVPNLIYPLMFGLDYHGEYIFLIATPMFIAFLVGLPFDNIVIKEIASNKLNLMGVLKTVFLPKVCLASLFLSIYAFAFSQELFYSLFYVIAICANSFFLHCLYGANKRRFLIVLLLVVNLFNLAIGFICAFFGLSPFLLFLMTIGVNFVFAFLACVFSLSSFGGDRVPSMTVKRIALFTMNKSAMSTLTYGLVAVAGFNLNAERLSVLRITISIAQAATSIFPVNPNTIFSNLVKMGEARHDGDHTQKYLTAGLSVALIYGLLSFSGIAMVLWMLAIISFDHEIIETVRKYASGLIFLAPAFAIYLVATILEKYIIAVLSERQGAFIGVSSMLLTILTTYILTAQFTFHSGEIAYVVSAALYILIGSSVLMPRSRPIYLYLSLITLLYGALTLIMAKIAGETHYLFVFLLLLIAMIGIVLARTYKSIFGFLQK